MTRRSKKTTAAVLAGAVTGVVGAVAWAHGATADPDPAGQLPAEKAAQAQADEVVDRANAAVATDPDALEKVVEEKAAEAAAQATEASDSDAGDEWPVGIFDDAEAPVPGMVFLGTNRWVGKIGGRSIAVYAGRAGDDPTIGRVLVVWASSEDTRGTTLDLPGAGALEVVAGEPDSTTLTLVDAAGARHVLDVVSQAWQ
ncbi:hypothetical protein ACFJIY_22145 [Pimelobacter simplex]|uniref:hypothetical protein n=1 Tax=Nocardioides simplex TaxID=2045 RepID=UPI0036729650